MAVWMVEALKQDFDLTLLTWEPIDLEPINEFYGTTLQESEFRVSRAHWVVRAIVRSKLVSKDPPDLPKLSIMFRLCKLIRRHYDILVTAYNEADFGCRGIQYIHYPWWGTFYQETLPSRAGWWHLLPDVLRGRAPWPLIYGLSFERIRNNLTLVNSDWTGKRFSEFYDAPAATLHPPVPGDFPNIPWGQRENGFVCIGRIAREKKLEEIIDIVAALRESVPDAHLHIIGSMQGEVDYLGRVRRKMAGNTSWIFLHLDISRAELVQIVAGHRYGIHGMVDEHFGIAVAEMIKAGCVVFTPGSAGPAEIVGAEKRLLYHSSEDAINKIIAVTNDCDAQQQLRSYLAKRAELFSTEIFMSRVREVVGQFLKQNEEARNH